ncbi:hypothetical protein NCCP1664_13760 [Zafaria cholistanensis]|uniref:Uncharacterized protein n=1 Tax=Zafaria cholistanensis TaxID=1682741 RepID=A0A5A7NQA1_9MICC|nr:hypothetical protein NCCP1664_13760 [Zafaria cholistanensis]
MGCRTGGAGKPGGNRRPPVADEPVRAAAEESAGAGHLLRVPRRVLTQGPDTGSWRPQKQGTTGGVRGGWFPIWCWGVGRVLFYLAPDAGWDPERGCRKGSGAAGPEGSAGRFGPAGRVW